MRGPRVSEAPDGGAAVERKGGAAALQIRLSGLAAQAQPGSGDPAAALAHLELDPDRTRPLRQDRGVARRKLQLETDHVLEQALLAVVQLAARRGVARQRVGPAGARIR